MRRRVRRKDDGGECESYDGSPPGQRQEDRSMEAIKLRAAEQFISRQYLKGNVASEKVALLSIQTFENPL